VTNTDLVVRLGLTLVLCAAVGTEREMRAKAAGLRTHTLVGLGAAVAMIVGKYGFADVLSPGRVALDPSRVAAQIVSGVGVIGAGLIFVRRESVRGLTTAAVVWVCAMIGMAAGAGLLLVSTLATVGHFLVVVGLPRLARLVPQLAFTALGLHVVYEDGRGVLRDVLETVTRGGYRVADVVVDHSRRGARTISVDFEIIGRDPRRELVSAIDAVDGVISVTMHDHDSPLG
jgi:putative Mg2+ transporter-C (MgtC) family protein